jgi:Xaa-Pro aminopeptidase
MSDLLHAYNGPRVLSLREQSRVVDEVLRDRFKTILPMALREAGLDMWIIVCNEDNYDPVFKTMLPWECHWAPILQIVVLHDKGKRAGVERLNVSRTDMLGMMKPAWKPDGKLDQWATLRKLVSERNPKRIGINQSDVIWAADGLTATLKNKLVKALGPRFAPRLVSAEKACTHWLATLTGRELDLYEHVCGVAHAIIASCFSKTAITAGVTTCDDLRWRFWQTASDLGLGVSFQPYFSRIRSKKSARHWGKDDKAIRHGDILHCDVGIEYLRLMSDHQELAYVLRPDETEPPQGLRDGLAWANRLQDVFAGVWGKSLGLSGNEILERALKAAHKEGIPNPKIYSHSLGHCLHEPGPLIGLPWEQVNTGARGQVVLDHNMCFTMELCVRCPVPEWGGQEVVFGLEQDVSFTPPGIHFIAARQTGFHLI